MPGSPHRSAAIVTLDLDRMASGAAPGVQEAAVRAIEDGGVLVLPRLDFRALRADERRFLSPDWSDGRAKNISLDGAGLKGARGAAEDLAEIERDDRALRRLMPPTLVVTLFPRYAPFVQRARTSYRPQPRRRPRVVLAQGRFAAARRCLSVAAQCTASGSCACSRNVNLGRGSRLARRRTLRGRGQDVPAADPRPAARDRQRCLPRCT